MALEFFQNLAAIFSSGKILTGEAITNVKDINYAAFLRVQSSLFYKRELWASKSAGAHSTKSLKFSGCKRSAGLCTHCTRANAFPAIEQSRLKV